MVVVEIDEEGGERQEEKREHHLYVHPFSFYFFALYYLKLGTGGCWMCGEGGIYLSRRREG